MFILTSLFFYCSTAKADDSDSNVIELYDYETGQTSNISISDYSINFLPASGIYNAYSDESTSSEPKPIAIGIHIKGIPNIGYNTGRKFDSTLISYIEYMRTN